MLLGFNHRTLNYRVAKSVALDMLNLKCWKDVPTFLQRRRGLRRSVAPASIYVLRVVHDTRLGFYRESLSDRSRRPSWPFLLSYLQRSVTVCVYGSQCHLGLQSRLNISYIHYRIEKANLSIRSELLVPPCALPLLPLSLLLNQHRSSPRAGRQVLRRPAFPATALG